MLLHIDENVPSSVADVFRARHHDVQLVRDIHARGTPDAVVAKAAIAAGAVVLTWDDDFKKLASRPHNSGLHVVTFACPETDGASRARQEIETIEFWYALSIANGERLRVEVTKISIRRVRD